MVFGSLTFEALEYYAFLSQDLSFFILQPEGFFLFLVQEPEFKLPDSSVDQWASPPSAGDDGDETEGEREDRRRRDRRRSPPVSNGSPRMRNIDGSEILGESQ